MNYLEYEAALVAAHGDTAKLLDLARMRLWRLQSVLGMLLDTQDANCPRDHKMFRHALSILPGAVSELDRHLATTRALRDTGASIIGRTGNEEVGNVA